MMLLSNEFGFGKGLFDAGRRACKLRYKNMGRKEIDTVITIDRDILPLFNELRAREAGRRKVGTVTQSNFVRFLLALYKQIEDSTILEAARESAGEKK